MAKSLKDIKANSVSGLNSGVDSFNLSKSKWFSTVRRGYFGPPDVDPKTLDSGLEEDMLQELSQDFANENKWRSHVHARHGMDVEFEKDKLTGKIVALKNGKPVGNFAYNNKSVEDTSGYGNVRAQPLSEGKWIPKFGDNVLHYGDGEHKGKFGKVVSANIDTTTISPYQADDFTVPTNKVCIDESVKLDEVINPVNLTGRGFTEKKLINGAAEYTHPKHGKIVLSNGRWEHYPLKGFPKEGAGEDSFYNQVFTKLKEDSQLDEISNQTKIDYAFKSFEQGNELHDKLKDKSLSPEEKKRISDKISKRNNGVIAANASINKIKEEHMYQDIYDEMNPEATLGEWVKTFQNSKDNRFYGKSLEERANQAIFGYFYTADKNGVELSEDVIDETFKTIQSVNLDEVNKSVSKMLIKKVVKKAAEQAIEKQNA